MRLRSSPVNSSIGPCAMMAPRWCDHSRAPWVCSAVSNRREDFLDAPLNVKEQHGLLADTRPKKGSSSLVAIQRQLVDTNVLARFFTGEPEAMAVKARRLIERADNGEVVLVVLPVILAELVYTLESFYDLERRVVATKLLSFLQSRGIEAVESARLVDALKRCRDGNAHFADAYLAASAVELGNPIASFDRDFDKFKDVRRVEPKA